MHTKKNTTYKRTVSVRLDERILCHLADHKASMTGVIDDLLRQVLIDRGIDLTKPHRDETCGIDASTGARITYGQHFGVDAAGNVLPLKTQADYDAEARA